jgi:hypothetical protein
LIFNQKLNIMRLLKMFFVLMIAAMAIGLSSCAKEEVSPPVVDADASEMIYANASGEREDDPDEDCRCEVRVVSVTNAPTGNTDWSFSRLVGLAEDPGFQFRDDEWRDENLMYQTTYPTDWQPINTPDPNNWYTFSFLGPLGSLNGTEDLTVRIEVRCYTDNGDGTETLATTTFHEFTVSDHVSSEPGGIFHMAPIYLGCVDQDGGQTVSP